MSIDTDHPLAYELLSMVIDEFERQALESGEREALLATANGPLTAMESTLDSSEIVLTKMKAQRENAKGEKENGEKKSAYEFMTETGIEFDKDMLELFGGPDNPVKNYLEECLGCNLRLQFDWQLKPLALLGPINAFIDSIMNSLERMNRRLDPFEILKDICWALDTLKSLCPADLIMLVMALKMLLKKYLLQLFNIKLDWTVLLGPLLKFIVEGIATLLEQIVGVILAPIDCVLGMLYTTNTLLKETAELLNDVAAFGAGLGQLGKDISNGDLPIGLEGNTIYRDAKWITPPDRLGSDVLRGPERNISPAPDPGFLQTRDHRGAEEKISNSKTFLTGFELRTNITLEEALADPLFSERSTFLEKIIVPIQEARNWIKQLFDNVIDAIRSLQGLVSGGLALNLDFLGIMIFIGDIIGLIMMIIRLLGTNIKVKDWCTELQQNPELLESQLRGLRAGAGVTVEATDNSELVLRRGPDIVGTIKTCSSSRTDADAQVVNQWIEDLKARGTR